MSSPALPRSLPAATPTVGTIHGQQQVIFFTQKGLVSCEPKTGKVLWRHPYKYSVSTAASPIIAGDIVYCSAGYGVGATRWEVIRAHVLPYAAPGIITGMILSLARALGEAAPLLLVGATMGRLAGQPSLLDLAQIRERFTALPIIVTQWTKNPQEGFDEIAAAAIVVMLVIVVILNTIAILLRNRYEKKRN